MLITMVYLKSEKYQYFEFSIFVENIVTVSSHSWELFVLYCPLVILDNPTKKGSKDICFTPAWLLLPASYYWIFIVGLFPRYILNGFQPITEGLNKMYPAAVNSLPVPSQYIYLVGWARAIICTNRRGGLF